MAQSSEQVDLLFEALHAFQGEVGKVLKDADNPFFHSRYATLNAVWETIQPVLHKHGLVVIQLPDQDGLTTTIAHTSGQFYSAWAKLANITDPHKQGGSITYMRRYALAGLGIVIDEDDDANAATQEVKQSTTPSPGRSIADKGTAKWRKNK